MNNINKSRPQALRMEYKGLPFALTGVMLCPTLPLEKKLTTLVQGVHFYYTLEGHLCGRGEG